VALNDASGGGPSVIVCEADEEHAAPDPVNTTVYVPGEDYVCDGFVCAEAGEP